MSVKSGSSFEWNEPDYRRDSTAINRSMRMRDDWPSFGIAETIRNCLGFVLAGLYRAGGLHRVCAARNRSRSRTGDRESREAPGVVA